MPPEAGRWPAGSRRPDTSTFRARVVKRQAVWFPRPINLTLMNHSQCELLASDEMLRSVSATAYGKNVGSGKRECHQKQGDDQQAAAGQIPAHSARVWWRINLTLMNHSQCELLASDEMLRSVSATAYGKNFDEVEIPGPGRWSPAGRHRRKQNAPPACSWASAADAPHQNHSQCELLASDEMLRSVSATAYGKNFDEVRQRLKRNS
jgi:hypothetical protein